MNSTRQNILLLSSLCLINIIQAKEIPSFNLILSNVDKSLVFALREYVAGEHYNIPEDQATKIAFRDYLLDEYYNIPLEDIEPTIISWFKENPALYGYANGNNITQKDDFDDYIKLAIKNLDLDIVHQRLFETKKNLEKRLAQYMQKQTYVDGFRVLLHLAIHYNHKVIAAKCQEVIRVLKNLGIEQTFSDGRIDLLVQLETACSESHIKPIRDILKKEITILKKLLATYK